MKHDPKRWSVLTFFFELAATWKPGCTLSLRTLRASLHSLPSFEDLSVFQACCFLSAVRSPR